MFGGVRREIGQQARKLSEMTCQSPATAGLFRTVGYGGDSGSIRDIEQADLVLIVGSNTAESHPVLATRVARSHKMHGQQLIVADLREHEMAQRADLFFRPRPGRGRGKCRAAL